MGFASKACRLSYGMDAAVAAVKKGKSRLIITADDVSQKSKKEIVFYTAKYSVESITLNGVNMQSVSDAVGRRCGILSVNDSGFADALKKAYFEGGNANDE